MEISEVENNRTKELLLRSEVENNRTKELLEISKVENNRTKELLQRSEVENNRTRDGSGLGPHPKARVRMHFLSELFYPVHFYRNGGYKPNCNRTRA